MGGAVWACAIGPNCVIEEVSVWVFVCDIFDTDKVLLEMLLLLSLLLQDCS